MDITSKWQGIKENKLSEVSVQNIVRVVMLIFFILAVALTLANLALKSDEVFIVDQISNFIKTGKLKIASVSPELSVKVFVYSVPLRIANLFTPEAQVFLLRLIGILFGLAVIYLGFLTAKAVFPKNNFMQIILPIFIAANPQFLSRAVSLSSDILLVLLAVLFLYELINILARQHSLIDLLIVVLSGFIVSEIRPELKNFIFITFLVTVACYLYLEFRQNYEEKIKEPINFLIPFIFIIFTALLIRRGFSLSQAPLAFFKSLVSPFVNIKSWPRLFSETTAFFSSAVDFPGSFIWVRTVAIFITRLTAAVSVLGAFLFVVKAAMGRQKVEPAPKAETPLSDRVGENDRLVIIMGSIILALSALLVFSLSASYEQPGALITFLMIIFVPLFYFLSLGLMEVTKSSLGLLAELAIFGMTTIYVVSLLFLIFFPS